MSSVLVSVLAGRLEFRPIRKGCWIVRNPKGEPLKVNGLPYNVTVRLTHKSGENIQVEGPVRVANAESQQDAWRAVKEKILEAVLQSFPRVLKDHSSLEVWAEVSYRKNQLTKARKKVNALRSKFQDAMNDLQHAKSEYDEAWGEARTSAEQQALILKCERVNPLAFLFAKTS